MFTAVFFDGRYGRRRNASPAECDVIIADYSSVVIDALLFGRPLALWCEDLETYTRLRPLPYFDFRNTFGWALRKTLPRLPVSNCPAAQNFSRLPPSRWTALHAVPRLSTDIRAAARGTACSKQCAHS